MERAEKIPNICSSKLDSLVFRRTFTIRMKTVKYIVENDPGSFI